MVIIDIRVGDDNAKEILQRTGMNHRFTAPIGFAGGVCIFWESSKVFLMPHKFEEMHLTFLVKVSFDIFVHATDAYFVLILCAPNGTLFTCATAVANGSGHTMNSCREFDNNATSRTTRAPRLS